MISWGKGSTWRMIETLDHLPQNYTGDKRYKGWMQNKCSRNCAKYECHAMTNTESSIITLWERYYYYSHFVDRVSRVSHTATHFSEFTLPLNTEEGIETQEPINKCWTFKGHYILHTQAIEALKDWLMGSEVKTLSFASSPSPKKLRSLDVSLTPFIHLCSPCC